MKRSGLSTSLLLLSCLSIVSSTIAATLTFDGGNNTTNAGSARTWSTGTSWNTETAPATGDDLVIGGTALNGGILVLGNGSYMAMTATANSAYSPTLRSVTFDNSLSQFPVGGLEMRNSSSATPGNNTLNLNTPDIDALVLKGGTAPALTLIARNANATLSLNLTYTGLANFAVNSGGTLTFDGVNNGTTPMITGTGGITKTGNGTLSLINVANTFSGGLTIAEGTVSFATSNRLGGELALNATALVLNGGTLTKTGNTTTTSVSNRGFALGNANGTINVADPAGLFIINGVIADVLTQNGTLTKTGPGTLTLTATNTFSGGLTLNGGTLSIDSTLRLGNATVVNTNHLILANGTLQFTGNSSTTSSANRGMRVGNATSVIEVTNESASLRLLNSVRDVSGQAGVLTKTGPGSLSLEGNSYSYTGGTVVGGGTLVVNGGTIGGNASLSGITLLAGTTLRGNGTFNGNSTFANGSTIDIASYDNNAQTAAVGTLVFNQNIDLGSATLLYNLDTPSSSDLITLAPGAVLNIGSGAVDLADFVFTTGGGYAPGVYPLISSTSPIIGALGSVTTGTLGGESITLGLNSTGDTLQLTVGTPAPSDTTPPVITRTGSASVSVAWGSTYTDDGATATDNQDPSVNVNTNNPVNTAKPGVYTVTYTATDLAGNIATPVTRTVTVAMNNASIPGVDGLSPLMKYALGANSPSESALPPSTSTTASELSLTAVVRTNDSALTVSGETTADLSLPASWTSTGVNVVNAPDQTNLPANCVRRVYTVTTSGASKKFLRLKVAGSF